MIDMRNPQLNKKEAEKWKLTKNRRKKIKDENTVLNQNETE